MKKLGWYLVSAAVAAFILCGGLLLAANLYVQSRVVQHRIRLTLGTSLRMPVSIKKTTFTPWDGLRIDGLAARPESEGAPPGGAGPAPSNFLNAASFRVHFALGALLRRQLVVEDVLLDRPDLSWSQDAHDRWRLPTAKPEASHPHDTPGKSIQVPPAHDALPSPVPTPATAGAVSPGPSAAAPPNPEETPVPGSRTLGLRVSVNKFRLRHGSMDFLNHRRGLLGRFDEVDVDGQLDDAGDVAGFATVGKAALPRAGLKLTQFQSHFLYSPPNGLALNNTQALLAGGKVAASCRVHTADNGSPFVARCQLDNVGIGQLIKEAGGKHGFVDGRLQGTLNVSGVPDDAEQCSATGHVQLNDTRVLDFPLFQTVGDALQIEDLRHLQFKTAQLDYRLEGTTLHIQPLVLASDHVQITANGRYQLREDRLDLHARLVVGEVVAQKLPRFIQQQFSLGGDAAPDTRFIDFKINGPLNKLSSNLYQRILPNSLDGLLDNFLRPRQKHPKESAPRPDEESTPPTDDAPTPDDP